MIYYTYRILTPASIWPEWMVSVPLIAFIALSVDDKPYLSKKDLSHIVSLHLCILFGALLQTTQNIILSYVYLLCSCIFCVPSVLIVLQARKDLRILLAKSLGNESKKGALERLILLASRKATLSYCIGCLFPVFPLIYFLKYIDLIDNDVVFVGFMFTSAFTKILFASLCMDAHLEVSHPAIALIDAEKFSHTSRRAFLRYVFHEVRVPLNSISLGVQILSSSELLDKTDMETVGMIREAVTFMGETLNDVMALQKIEEGSMELIYKAFSISDLFQNVEDSFIDISVDMGVALSTEIDPNLPPRVIGDKFRIRHVLANLVSNAIKFSFSGGLVQLKAQLSDKPIEADIPRTDTGEYCTVKFIVIDEGKGISPEDQEDDIFRPYRSLKQGELKSGRGSGLGLAISREIIRMHGGTIAYTSTLGKGSSFYIHLPLEKSSENTSPSWHSTQRRSTKKAKKPSLSSHLNVLLANQVNSESRPGSVSFSPYSRTGQESAASPGEDSNISSFSVDGETPVAAGLAVFSPESKQAVTSPLGSFRSPKKSNSNGTNSIEGSVRSKVSEDSPIQSIKPRIEGVELSIPDTEIRELAVRAAEDFEFTEQDNNSQSSQSSQSNRVISIEVPITPASDKSTKTPLTGGGDASIRRRSVSGGAAAKFSYYNILIVDGNLTTLLYFCFQK